MDCTCSNKILCACNKTESNVHILNIINHNEVNNKFFKDSIENYLFTDINKCTEEFKLEKNQKIKDHELLVNLLKAEIKQETSKIYSMLKKNSEKLIRELEDKKDEFKNEINYIDALNKNEIETEIKSIKDTLKSQFNIDEIDNFKKRSIYIEQKIKEKTELIQKCEWICNFQPKDLDENRIEIGALLSQKDEKMENERTRKLKLNEKQKILENVRKKEFLTRIYYVLAFFIFIFINSLFT